MEFYIDSLAEELIDRPSFMFRSSVFASLPRNQKPEVLKHGDYFP